MDVDCTIRFFTKNKIWKNKNHNIIFAAVLLDHLSRKAEGHGPMKP